MLKRKSALAAVAALCLSLVLGGCASGISLDESAAANANGAAGANAAGVNANGVAGVELASDAGTAQQPPESLSRLVYFAFDSFAISDEFTPLLAAHARFLNTDRTRRVVVEGNTDERGGREYNLALGQQRAEAVRRALSLLGVQDSQMEAVSFGEEKPAALGGDEASMSLNRRALINYR
jgi:peptidoglycan-associated lipoprotein